MPNASEPLQPDPVIPNLNVSTPVKAQRVAKPVETVTPDHDIQKPFRETTTPVVNNVPAVNKNNTPSETGNFSKEPQPRQRELSTASEADPTGFKILKVHPANEKPSLNSDDELKRFFKIKEIRKSFFLSWTGSYMIFCIAICKLFRISIYIHTTLTLSKTI